MSATMEAPASSSGVGEIDLLVFDIETGPAPTEVIEAHMPEFEAPANYKDPVKIEAALAEKRKSWADKAALSPITGRVLAVGIWADGKYSAFIVDSEGEEAEKELLEWFWKHVSINTKLIGWNSNRFDLPFLLKRSWALGVRAPFGLAPGGRFDSRTCVDLMEIWNFGDKTSFSSLDSVAKYFGVGTKNGDGELFHQVLKAFPDEAAAYLENDIRLTFGVARSLGILDADFDGSAAESSTSTEEEDY